MRRLAERLAELPAEVGRRQVRGPGHVGDGHRLGVAAVGEVAGAQQVASGRDRRHAPILAVAARRQRIDAGPDSAHARPGGAHGDGASAAPAPGRRGVTPAPRPVAGARRRARATLPQRVGAHLLVDPLDELVPADGAHDDVGGLERRGQPGAGDERAVDDEAVGRRLDAVALEQRPGQPVRRRLRPRSSPPAASIAEPVELVSTQRGRT